MPKRIEPLNDLKIRNAKPKDRPYSLRDGEGLYVYVKPNGKKIFRLDYSYMGKRNTYTIGEYPQISLSRARAIKYELKDLIKQGIDPNRHKQEQQRLQQLQANKKRTYFVIDQFLALKEKEVSKERFERNYRQTFANYVDPIIGDIPIDEVTKTDLIKVIKEVKNTKRAKDTRGSDKTYKAREVYRLLYRLFEFATHNDYIQTNPAQTIDIDNLIPKHKPKRLKAITDERIKEVYQKLLTHPNLILRNALRYIALTAVRPANVANLKWEYIDFDKRRIVYPAEVMKSKREPFRIPLTDTLIAILKEMEGLCHDDLVFCAINNHHKQIHNNALRNALIEVGVTDHTPHGFRSAFETIAMEHQKEHGCSFEAIEAQLHHNIGTKVTRSYLRTDFLEERYTLLEWWERYLTNRG